MSSNNIEENINHKIIICCECNKPIKTYNFMSVGFNFLNNLKYKHNDCDNPLWEEESEEEEDSEWKEELIFILKHLGLNGSEEKSEEKENEN